jgi:organic radical activating enzyme
MDLKSVKADLDAIGPGMCLAKWKQVTIHLPTGHTHSCHHPNTHVIPISEIKVNPSALHNTQFKKNRRKEMLEGHRPDECRYCWNVEDSVKDDTVFSDRVFKSSDPWSWPHFQEVIDAGYTGNISPSYLEISFSYGCNFKCGYCSPEISSKWMEEIQQHGGYPTHLNYNNLKMFEEHNKLPIPEREENPYVDAFWQWWPELYPNLHTFRITGGEPLMTKHTFRVLDYILENPNVNLELGINSNLGVPDKLINDFISKIKTIQEKKSVKSITVYTSCEAYGNKAEYIRHGLNYNEWIANCNKVLSECPGIKLVLMSTYNALSVTSYTNFLEDMLKLKEQYIPQGKWVGIDIPYLRNPEFLTMSILTADYLSKTKKSWQFMQDNSKFFTPYEIGRMQRVYELFKSQLSNPIPYLIDWRKDFVLFVDEHDRRRETNFLGTFPEMLDFYQFCKKI